VFELWNATPNQDLAGLSPNALAELLEDPFEATDVLVFADVLSRTPRAPVVTVLTPLFEALMDGPAKATASGYLPRPLCAAIEQRAFEQHGVSPFDTLRPKVTSESAFRALHVARLVASFAGLLRKYRGAFVLTRKGRLLFERRGMAGVYPELLRAFTTRLEWASLDGYPRVSIVQASFAFSLVLLLRYGRTTRPGAFYAERWLAAFPGIDDAFEASDPAWRDPRIVLPTGKQRFTRCYQVRVLQRFLGYFGLAEVREERPGSSVSVFATPLLHDVVAWRQGG